jgi:hypothetical protein
MVSAASAAIGFFGGVVDGRLSSPSKRSTIGGLTAASSAFLNNSAPKPIIFAKNIASGLAGYQLGLYVSSPPSNTGGASLQLETDIPLLNPLSKA